MAFSSSLDPVSIRPEVLAFFRDIKEHPDDDTPRLVFADWLQEHGDATAAARGEFLRLSVLRHRLAPDDPSYELLKRREGELFRQYGWAWLGPLADAARAWTFERGMVQITALAGDLRSLAVSTWARTESALWIDALKLPLGVPGDHGAAEDHANHLAYSPLLPHIIRIDLSDHANPFGMRFLFRALRDRNLPFLRELLLSRSRLTTRHVTSLARCRHLRRLRLLDLQQNQLTDGEARLLAESPHLTSGPMLRLGHNRFTAEGIALLRQAFGERVSF